MNHRMQGLGCWMWVMIGLWLGIAPITSMARIDIRVTQSGSQVDMRLSGSAKTSAFPTFKRSEKSAYVEPTSALLVGGGEVGGEGYSIPTMEGPQRFGRSARSAASSASGSWAGITNIGAGAGLNLPTGYRSGGPLNGSATYRNTSICSLGLAPGTYTWTWGSGSNADSLVLTIAPDPSLLPPTVTAVTPASGLSTGGTSVIIAGTNFCGITGITIGGVACRSFGATSSTSASCLVPPGVSGPASVVVTTASGSNAANTLFSYTQPPPTVTAVSPANGPAAGGTAITLTGTNFTHVTGITVGGQACASFTVTSATSATCTTPAGTAGSASVVVTTAGGSNATNRLFTYLGTCTSFSQTIPGNYACIVPAGTTSLNYTVIGRHGYNGLSATGQPTVLGGRGAKITGMLAVTPGQVLYMTVAMTFSGSGAFGMGGHYSSISTVSSSVGPVVVAGGGGGGGQQGSATQSSGRGGDAGISSSPAGTGGGAGGAGSNVGGSAANGAAGGQAATGGAGGAAGNGSPMFNGGTGGSLGRKGNLGNSGGSGGAGFGITPSGGRAGSGFLPPGGGGGGGGLAVSVAPSPPPPPNTHIRHRHHT